MFDSVFFECSRQPNTLSCFFLSFNLKVFCVDFNAKAITLVLHNLIFLVVWTMGFHRSFGLIFTLLRHVFSLY